MNSEKKDAQNIIYIISINGMSNTKNYKIKKFYKNYLYM